MYPSQPDIFLKLITTFHFGVLKFNKCHFLNFYGYAFFNDLVFNSYSNLKATTDLMPQWRTISINNAIKAVF